MLLNAGKSNTHNFGLIIVYGVLYFVVYYAIFTFLIRRLNIPTPAANPPTHRCNRRPVRRSTPRNERPVRRAARTAKRPPRQGAPDPQAQAPSPR